MIGWIKLHRQIMENETIWNNDEPFDCRSAWIDILLNANHKDRRIRFDAHGMTVKCGQWLTSINKLSERWHWSVNRTRRYLDFLENEHMIERKSDNKKSLLTVLNYAKYQGFRDIDQQQTDGLTDGLTNGLTDGVTDGLTNDKQEYKRMNKKEKNEQEEWLAMVKEWVGKDEDNE